MTPRATRLAWALTAALAGCGDDASTAIAQRDSAALDATPTVDAPDVLDASEAPDASLSDAPLTDAPSRDVVRDAGRRAVTVSAYYAGWMQDAVAPSTIDFASLDEVHHFCLVPRADGTLDGSENGITPAHARALVAAAHQARRKALISVGGANTVAGFRGAWSDAHRAAFVAAIVRFATDYGYDGVDVDVEPLAASDAANLQRFVRALRAALDAARPGAMLTAAAGDAPGAYVPVRALFDQINVMTYDLSGPWPGWVTWHNTALHNGGARFPSTGTALPSVETALAAFVAAGVEVERLGLGVDFYGYEWTGASAPQQPVAGVTMRTLSYAEIMDTRWRADRARWDATAMVPWLSLDAPGTSADRFVSYDDARSATAKVEYARARGLGSVIVWELGGAWRASQPAGSRDELLRAVGRAASGG